MIDEMIHQVMTKFPEAKSLVGSIDYDMLLVNNKEEPPLEPSLKKTIISYIFLAKKPLK
jgi:hypothetical protein